MSTFTSSVLGQTTLGLDPRTWLGDGQQLEDQAGPPAQVHIDEGASGYGISAQSLDAQHVQANIPKGLYALLHEGIREEHTLARKNEFLNSLIEGKMTFCSKAYVVYLCNLFVLHKAIEKAQAGIIEQYGTDFFVFPALFRSERLLSDIKMWSIFNSLSTRFADKDAFSDRFKEEIESIAESSAKEFAKKIEGMSISVAGVLFSLYGTIMAGGQRVKKGGDGHGGVMSGFVCRIQDPDDDEYVSTFKTQLRQKIGEDPSLAEEYAQQSVSFFSFPEGFSIPEFKRDWHGNLDALPEKLQLSGSDKEGFEQKVLANAKQAVSLVTDFIASMLKNIDKH